MKRATSSIIFLSVLFLSWLSSDCLYAQKATLKTNLLYWATATPNLGAEFATGKRTSLALHAGIQPWQYNDGDKKLKHWMVQPEFRWWPCEVFMGHVIGIHALGGQFNAGGIDLPFNIIPAMESHRYQGWAAGAGISYGYHLLLNRRWSMEFGIGFGYLYVDYKEYRCIDCGKAKKKEHHNYIGPTKAAINLIYNF